jgi:hypothetical protein
VSRRRRTSPDGNRSLHRTAGPSRARRLFYVAVEGEVTEPAYLSHLNREFGERLGFQLIPLTAANGLKPCQAVAKVAAYTRDIAEDRTSDQLWALFDRDQHVGIPEAFRDAAKAGVRVAFSNPSFDLWLLLHISDFSGAQSGSSDVVHEKLRKYAAFGTFGDRDKRLTAKHLDLLRGQEVKAANRARRLANDCATSGCSAQSGHADHCPRIDRDPCTEMWELLVELGVVSSA